MSNDEVRWCDNDENNEELRAKCTDNASRSNDVNVSYTLLPVYHIEHRHDNYADDDQISVINIHRHRNIHINRDSRNKVYNNYDNSASSCHHQRRQRGISRSYYQIVNVCLIMCLLHVFVTSVACDELMDSTGARGHFTHTWAVHIPGGEEVAKAVADEHGMIFRGKVSAELFIEPETQFDEIEMSVFAFCQLTSRSTFSFIILLCACGSLRSFFEFISITIFAFKSS